MVLRSLSYIPTNACTSAAAPGHVPLSCSPVTSPSAAAPRSRPPQLLLPGHVPFSCCSPVTSPSAAAPRSRPPQLLLPGHVPLSCCSPVTSPSAAAPRSRPPQLLHRFSPRLGLPNVLKHSSWSSRFGDCIAKYKFARH